MHNYNLTHDDLISVRQKIKNQEKYLEENSFTTATGQVKTLADVSFGANLSKRYFPRILNKVDTFVSLNLNRDYVPVFLTVTLDGFFRDTMRGDYSRYTDKVKKKYEEHIPNNDRFGYYRDMMDKKEPLTPKDLYKILSHQLHRFIRSYTLQKIRKEGLDYSFIRVTEPHKDGVPHFHILMYLPAPYISDVCKEFHKFFPAPRNSKRITKRDGGRVANKIGEHYETLGFQTEIRSPVGYILKYILKSFRNLMEEKEIDYLQAWYVHNKIPRIITTHTLVPQDIYQSTSMLDPDWYYLTNIKLIGNFDNQRDISYFRFDDGYGRHIIGDNGLYRIFNNGRLVKQYGSKDYKRLPKYRLRAMTFSSSKPTTFDLLHRYEIFIPIKKYKYYIPKKFDDGTYYFFGSTEDIFMTFLPDLPYHEPTPQYEKPVIQLSDLALFDLYNHFDFDKYHPKRFGMVQNEMINRGLLHMPIQSLNDFNFDFDFGEEYDTD